MAKNIFIVIAVLLFSSVLLEAQIYVSTDGNDSNPGTIDKPLKTISAAVSSASAGSTIYLRGGVYSSSSKIKIGKSGASNYYCNLFAYQAEKPVVDFTENSSDGISLSGNYWHIKGLEIRNAGHNGINISGSYNIIENCSIHDNKNTGMQMGSSSGTTYPSHNLILNCDSYFNFDPPIGGNADGFGAKWNIGSGNIYKSCRSYNNSDDGWDLWMADSSVEIDSCFAFRNGVDIWHTGQVDGNGNGFKLGGNYIHAHHTVKNCISFDNAGNTGRGFDENNNTAGQTVYNCTAYRNKGDNFHFNNTVVTGNHDIINCISYKGNVSIKSGTQEKNSWQGFLISDSDFLSIDTALALMPRDSSGNLQTNNFFRLAAGSPLIDAGVDVGIPYSGSAPDLGAFEYNAFDAVKKSNPMPPSFFLYQNFPNPFNPSTTIKFNIAEKGLVRLDIYNLIGQKVAELIDGNLSKGEHSINFNAANLSSGIYIYKLSQGEESTSRKLILLK